jgi:acetylglutamate kinase
MSKHKQTIEGRGKGLILIKYGGNAMLSEELKKGIADVVADLHRAGFEIVLVHGGGPFINKALEAAGIVSEFFDGQRYTTAEALSYIEKELKGEVNSSLTGLMNRAGLRAVGLSGKDGRMVTAVKRWHTKRTAGPEEKIDIGMVGDVAVVDPSLIRLLLQNGYTPVIACIAADEAGNEYNVNADMLGGHIAAALQADEYIVLTDVDGLFRNFPDPASIISQITIDELPELYKKVITGGMIPKVQSCEIAVRGGAHRALMMNGTKPELIRSYLLEGHPAGTVLVDE